MKVTLAFTGCLFASTNAFAPFTYQPQQQRPTPIFGAESQCKKGVDADEFLQDDSNRGIVKSSSPLVDCGSLWRSAALVVAGLALAGQVATASVLPAPEEILLSQKQDNGISYLRQVPSSIYISVDTMDFSLPSYDDSIKGGEMKTKPSDTSFNPFGDFEPKKVEDSQAKDEQEAKKAEAKAVAAEQEAKKAEAKAAAAEERAAAVARRAEEREAKRKAAEEEREAKRQAAAEAKDASSASTSEGESPSFEMPDFKAPEISLPAFKAPDFDIPKVEVPKVDLPKVDIPKIGVPKVDVSGVDVPKIDIPKFDSANLPSISLPKVGGGDGAKVDLSLEPQDVRDERARQARQTYLASDEAAKEAEAAARAAREAANEKLKLSRSAKDEACKTRPGGKLLCLRNPFSTGY